MDPLNLIPAADTIPAPAWLFLVLDIAMFTIHILLINVILGGILVTIYSRLKNDEQSPENVLHGAVTNKIPTIFALGINFGVAPLLFLQVIYGHLFYSSSVLMAVYWILVIPFLILAYYGAYIHARRYHSGPLLSQAALWISAVLILYIGFIFVNNMTLMLQPEKWTAYFENRGGTILNWTDPTVFPRYFHFVTASVAIGSLFMSMVWYQRAKKTDEQDASEKVKQGLKIFGYATIVQVIVGLWLLMAIPRDYLLQFMGANIFATLIFLIGFLCGIGTIATAFSGKFRPTLIMLLITIVAMVLNRHNLREMYLTNKFSLSQLELIPQYGVMALFFLVLAIGIAAVVYMVRQSVTANQGRTA